SGDHYKEYDYNVFTKLYSYFFVFGYYMRNISNKDIIDVVNREIRMSSQIITSIQENIDHIKNPKVDTGYMMVPSHNIGGEFIDLIRLTDTRHLFVVGDLSGKGIAASMNMVILKSIIRTYLSETHDFKELVTKVNTFVRDSLRKGTIFAGLFALIDFETDTMYYINCGIPALMMYTQVYNNVIEIQGSGHVLGFVKDISPYLSVKTIKLNRGDIILACTDGLINSHSLRGEQFGKERVQQALLDNSTYPAQRMAQFTFESLLKFMSKEMEDDVSILVLKYEYSVEYYEEETENQENEEETTEESSTEEATTETSQISENDSIPEERAEPSIEPSVDNSLNSEENLMAAAGLPDFGDFVMPSMDSVEPFDIEESVTKQAAVEEKATTEDIASSFGDDFGLPDDFDMSSLEGLDDLINKSDLS
ncbi:MAG: serine/threonine-protein phosphatase, partial [Treponema bryantii]|nr:serine/threonine-protein phosphatase [Treponema bryantii]